MLDRQFDEDEYASANTMTIVDVIFRGPVRVLEIDQAWPQQRRLCGGSWRVALRAFRRRVDRWRDYSFAARASV